MNAEAQNSRVECFPPASIYYFAKASLPMALSQDDLDGLYKCTLCNHCGMAGVNRNARNKAVAKDNVAPHVASVRESIRKYGNPYGIAPVKAESPGGRMDTVLFRGCTPTYKTPEILAAAMRMLDREGVEYGVMDGETCCGNILFNLGDRESGLEAVRKNVERFKAAGVKRIIAVCPGCYSALNKYYKGFEGFDAEIVLAADLLHGTGTDIGEARVQYSCHAKEKGDIIRKLVPGSVKNASGDCCGAGAGLRMHDRHLAEAKARRTAGVPGTIVTYCPFCYMSLSSVDPGNVKDIYVLLDSV
jgi:fumarate reductase (CoM/CoB) subunit B